MTIFLVDLNKEKIKVLKFAYPLTFKNIDQYELSPSDLEILKTDVITCMEHDRKEKLMNLLKHEEALLKKLEGLK